MRERESEKPHPNPSDPEHTRPPQPRPEKQPIKPYNPPQYWQMKCTPLFILVRGRGDSIKNTGPLDSTRSFTTGPFILGPDNNIGIGYAFDVYIEAKVANCSINNCFFHQEAYIFLKLTYEDYSEYVRLHKNNPKKNPFDLPMDKRTGDNMARDFRTVDLTHSYFLDIDQETITGSNPTSIFPSSSSGPRNIFASGSYWAYWVDAPGMDKGYLSWYNKMRHYNQITGVTVYSAIKIVFTSSDSKKTITAKFRTKLKSTLMPFSNIWITEGSASDPSINPLKQWN